MKTKQLENKISEVTAAWSAQRPAKSFAGMTLDEFKAAIKPSRDARSAVMEQEKNLTAVIVQRDIVDRETWLLVQRVVSAVGADEDEGFDGELYKAMGYVRRSERASGLSRGGRRESAEPQVAKAA